MSKFLNSIITLTIAALAAWFTAKTYYASFETHPSISITETARYGIGSSNNFAGTKLEYYIDGRKIENATVVTYKIKNTGQKSIQASDFESPLKLLSSNKQKILSAGILSKKPDSISPKIERLSENSFKIHPLLLNKNDEFDVSAIVLQSPGTAQSFPPPTTTNWSIRIKELPDVELVNFENYLELQTLFAGLTAVDFIKQFEIGWIIFFTPWSFLGFVLISTSLFFILRLAHIGPQLLNKSVATLELTKTGYFLVCIALAEVITFYIFKRPIKMADATITNSLVAVVYLTILLYFLFKRLSRQNHTNG